jgi:glycine hydroxymethyltransferase
LVGAFFMVDMAHIAGLVAAGVHPSPVPHADFVTTTTHKTLRGPRGGLILARGDFGKKLDSKIFPGIQGGPLVHVIAAKAVCLREAMAPEFTVYQQQVVKNAATLADRLTSHGFRLVSGGSDNHLMLVDLRNKNITGKEAERLLEDAGLTVNKNAVPFDNAPRMVTSGIRLGTPAVTTRGLLEAEMLLIGDWIDQVVTQRSPAVIGQVRQQVRELCERLPLYPGMPRHES